MSFAIVSRAGINIGADQWAFTITGDPSSGAGLKASIGSVAVQLDSSPANLFWEKTGPLQTDWSALSASGSAGVSAAASSSGGYRVSAYNVPIDGTTDGVAALNTLTGTTMPQTGGPYDLIVGPSEIIKTASNISLPKTVSLRGTGGQIKPAAGTVVTLAAQPVSIGKLFDTSLGGTVVFGGTGSNAKPVWWGADKTGVADSAAAVTAAFKANAGLNGGKATIESGSYKLNSTVTLSGDNYSYLVVEGDGPGTQLLNGNPQIAQNIAMLDLRGATPYGLKQVRIRSLRLSGANTSDLIRLLLIDNAENVRITDVYLENNACEGMLSVGNDNQTRRFTIENCHATNVGGSVGSAAFNFNAQINNYSNCSTDNCGNGIEVAGRFTSINNCIFYNSLHYCVMLNSTWSGYLDAYNGYVEVNTYGAIVQGCQFVGSQGYGIYMPDYTGHTNTDGAHPSPSHLDGTLGHVLIQNNFFDRCAKPINGGSDLLGPIECSTNDISGQYDGGTGPQNPALSPMAGTWNIHNNSFSLGKGIQFPSLIGYAFGTPNVNSRVTFLDNQVTNKCWSAGNGNGTGMAQFFRTGAAVGKTRFVDLDGTIAAVPAAVCYSFTDSGGAASSTCSVMFQDFDWRNSNHVFSLYYEQSVIPTINGVLPPQWSYKPGDILNNKGTGGWTTKRCVTGGTLNPTAITATATATNGTATITVTDGTAFGRYQWISFPAVPTVTNKQILSISGNVLTVDTNVEATITAGATIAWATPVFFSDRDLNTMTLPSMAAGDTFSASSATAITRLPKGNDGSTFTLASGVPAWQDAQPRYDAGNSSTAATITWTAARQSQKVTCTAATPVITIAGLASGADLVLDVFQDATGGRNPSFAQTGMGSIVWTSGGTAPTLTTTASKSDRYLFEYDGTRLVASVIWQNL